jgi:hypothetical protein
MIITATVFELFHLATFCEQHQLYGQHPRLVLGQ